jgi:hypothetical protein
MANRILDESAERPRIEDALDFVRLDEIGRLAGRAASYWHSVELAADRGDTLTVVTHCKQVTAITREVLTLVGTLGSSGDATP